MYRLFLAVFMISFLSGCAIPRPLTEEESIIQKVVDVPGYNKGQIFERSKMWFVENFRSAKSVIEYDNKDEGILIGKCVMELPVSDIRAMSTLPWRFKFTVKEEAKDNRLRLTYTNLIVIDGTGSEQTAWTDDDYSRVKPILSKMAADIAASVQSQTNNEKW
jgi:hypothetical protein